MKKTLLLRAHLLSPRACLWAAVALLAAPAFGPPPAQAAVTEAWVQRYNGPANNQDEPQAVAVDGSGHVVVTGYSYGTIFYADCYTAKYTAANGALLWEQRYSGGGASSLAVGPNGIVAVTGSSGDDYATVVYRENLPPISIALVPTGIRLRFTGIPDRSYTIECAPAVTGPWTTITTQTAPPSGLFEYIDAPQHSGSAFYRAVQP